jgi:hypothetical protein
LTPPQVVLGKHVGQVQAGQRAGKSAPKSEQSNRETRSVQP